MLDGVRAYRAAAAFGLEGIVRGELDRLGIQGSKGVNGGVRFMASPAEALLANMWLRCADRVLLEMGVFTATSFDMLYEAVRALEWERVVPPDGALPLTATCARSMLMSVRDVQSIAKKAIVDRLCKAYRLTRLPETGARYAVDVHIHSDEAVVTLNTSGEGLSRRGYRTRGGEAPLRETLAAAMLLKSPWRSDAPLYDPMCGSGTLLVEAAFIAQNRAPGIERPFDMERWGLETLADDVRADARARVLPGPFSIAGSDVDAAALELARYHIGRAGLDGRIGLSQCACADARPADGAHIIANPPYGARMGGSDDAAEAARQLGVLLGGGALSLTAITPDPAFERRVGRRAAARRRVYNGRLECEILTFYRDRQRAPFKEQVH